MKELENIIMSDLLNTKGVNTVLFVMFILILRSILNKVVLSSKIEIDEKRKWVIRLRNWTTIITLFALILIWFTEIQSVALSLAALALAIAVSLKEFIMSLSWGVMRSFNHPFKIGDRIEIDGVRGDVIDTNLLMTKLMEIGPHNLSHQYTGRAISLPNAVFLTNKIINESFMSKYVLHVFIIPLERSDNWKKAEQIVLHIANDECSYYAQEAERSMVRLMAKEGLAMPKVDPQVRFHLSADKKMEMVVRIPAPARKKGDIEQKILKRFMEEFLSDG